MTSEEAKGCLYTNETSAQNDVESANQRQAEFLLNKITENFAELGERLEMLLKRQDETLQKLGMALEKIEELKNNDKRRS